MSARKILLDLARVDPTDGPCWCLKSLGHPQFQAHNGPCARARLFVAHVNPPSSRSMREQAFDLRTSLYVSVNSNGELFVTDEDGAGLSPPNVLFGEYGLLRYAVAAPSLRYFDKKYLFP